VSMTRAVASSAVLTRWVLWRRELIGWAANAVAVTVLPGSAPQQPQCSFT
jgi:hypothetical protein